MAYISEIWLNVIIVTGAYHCISDCYGISVTLSSQPADQWEDMDITLTCTYNGTYRTNMGLFGWTLNDQNNAYVKSDNCTLLSQWLTNSKIYSYQCTNGTVHQITIKSITRQNHGDIWKCEYYVGVLSIRSQSVQIFVKVPVNQVTISPNYGFYTATENSLISLQCTTSECRPNRTWNGWSVVCGAGNRNENIILSSKILLNVTYPPDGSPKIRTYELGSEIKVIEDHVVDLECSISGGNPLPRLEWNQNNTMPQITSGITVTKKISWRARNVDKQELKCHSIQHHKNDTTFVIINVLYPPKHVVIKLKKKSGEFVNMTSTVSVIEGRQLILNCSAHSNPPVSVFEWQGSMSSDSSYLNIISIKRKQSGGLTCNVFNTMTPSEPNGAVTGNSSSSLRVDVLYPPRTKPLRDKTISEGEDLVYDCDFSPGNPNATEFKWMQGDKTWNGQQLLLTNVSRNQVGRYTCNIKNKMISSDGDVAVGTDSVQFNLIVQYEAKVRRFLVEEYGLHDNFVVTENENITLICEIGGHPFAAGEIYFEEADYFQRKQRVFKLPTTSTHYSEIVEVKAVFKAQCTDTGIHSCTGRNTLYTGLESVTNATISLHVNCKPRKSPFHHFPSSDTVYSQDSVPVVLNFTALAYPIPQALGFVWSRKTDSTMQNWTTINSNDIAMMVTTSGLQSNLTIKNVSHADYGLYRVMVENEIGQFNYTFDLAAAAQLNQLSKGSQVGAAVGGAVASVAILTSFITVFILYRKRKRRKEQSAPSKPSVLKKDRTIPKDEDGSSSADVNNSNFYEGLQNKGVDQQYDNLSSMQGELKFYANLQLTHDTKELLEEGLDEKEIPDSGKFQTHSSL